MAQQLRILQSLWAMERRRADAAEWPLQTQLEMIRDAGFDGAGVRFIDPDFAKEVTDFLRAAPGKHAPLCALLLGIANRGDDAVLAAQQVAIRSQLDAFG